MVCGGPLWLEVLRAVAPLLVPFFTVLAELVRDSCRRKPLC